MWQRVDVLMGERFLRLEEEEGGTRRFAEPKRRTSCQCARGQKGRPGARPVYPNRFRIQQIGPLQPSTFQSFNLYRPTPMILAKSPAAAPNSSSLQIKPSPSWPDLQSSSPSSYPSLQPISLIQWTPNSSSRQCSSRVKPWISSSVSTWITESGAVTAPLSPASTVIPLSGRCVSHSQLISHSTAS